MSEYVFEGEIIKLNAKDFYRWRDMYKFLNLTAELEQLDMELEARKREGSKVNKWFSECIERLNGRNKRAERNFKPTPYQQYQKLCDATGQPRDTRRTTLTEDLSSRDWAK